MDWLPRGLSLLEVALFMLDYGALVYKKTTHSGSSILWPTKYSPYLEKTKQNNL